MTKKYLPFFWDYKITKSELKKILRSQDEITKTWALSRILESAPFEEVWQYISLRQLKKTFSSLKLKAPIERAWQRALDVWK